MNPTIKEIAQCIDVPLMDCPNIASMIYDYIRVNIEEYLPPTLQIKYITRHDDIEESIHLMFRNGELKIYEEREGFEIFNEEFLEEHTRDCKIYVPHDKPNVYSIYSETYGNPYKLLYKIFSKKNIQKNTNIEIQLRGGFKKHLLPRNRYISIPYSKIRPGIAGDVYSRFFNEMKEYIEENEDKAHLFL